MARRWTVWRTPRSRYVYASTATSVFSPSYTSVAAESGVPRFHSKPERGGADLVSSGAVVGKQGARGGAAVHAHPSEVVRSRRGGTRDRRQTRRRSAACRGPCSRICAACTDHEAPLDGLHSTDSSSQRIPPAAKVRLAAAIPALGLGHLEAGVGRRDEGFGREVELSRDGRVRAAAAQPDQRALGGL
eukprot:742309-Prymnesium_polylepis.1